MMNDMVSKIKALKEEKNAIIMGHYYQVDEVQDIADVVGDSFMLSRMARDNEADMIVFCGVRFMAESAKILSPHKKVLLPALDAGCPMAQMVTAEDIRRLRKEHPDAAVVCYVNSTTEVKAESDICCTSSNAVKVVQSLDQDEVIFVPDENLARFVQHQVPEKKIITHPGYCIVHKRVRGEEVKKAKEAQPDALLLSHPECAEDVVSQSDFVGSTAQIIKYARESEYENFIIGTEAGILHTLRNENPNKQFYLLSPGLICANMKKTHLEDVLNALEKEQYEIHLDEDIIRRAKRSLDRMLEVKA